MRRMTSNETQVTFGIRLRAWRRNRGLSQIAFGELLNPPVGHWTICRWERGRRLPSSQFLRQIVLITGISAAVALGVQRNSRL